MMVASLETTALYGLLVWAYSAAVAVIDIGRLNDQLIHWLPLRIDTAGTVGFAVSALSFLLLQIVRPDRPRTGVRR
jgi:hypothetical protein